MSPAVHLLLVVSTLLLAWVGLMIAGLVPATIVSVTAAIVGVLLYLRPLDLLYDQLGTKQPGTKLIDRTGGNDVG